MKKRKYDYKAVWMWIKEHPYGVYPRDLLAHVGTNKRSVVCILNAIENTGYLLSEGNGKIYAFQRIGEL